MFDILIASLAYPTSNIDIDISVGPIIFNSVLSLPPDLVTVNSINIVHFTCDDVSFVVNNSRGIGALEFRIPCK